MKMGMSGGILKEEPTGFTHLDVRDEGEDHAGLWVFWLEQWKQQSCHSLRWGNLQKKQDCALAVCPGEIGNIAIKGKQNRI